MKKRLYSFLIVTSFMWLAGCSKTSETTYSDKSKIMNTAEQSNEKQKNSTQSLDDKSNNEPNGKISPEVSGEKIETFDSFDQLGEADKKEVIFDYLIQATLAIGNGEEGAKELLKEKGYDAQNIGDLLPEIENLRRENPHDDFNQLMILLVQFVMEDK